MRAVGFTIVAIFALLVVLGSINQPETPAERVAPVERGEAEAVTKTAAETVAPPQSQSHWRVALSTSKIDDSQNVHMHVIARAAVRDKFNRSYLPTLWITCRENTTALFINFDGLFMADIQGYGDVTYRVDKNPAGEVAMTESTNSEALGLWNGGRSIPFIQKLFGGSTLLIRATPYNESAVDMEFPLTSLSDEIVQLRRACGW